MTSIDVLLACIRDTQTADCLTVQATLIDKTYQKAIKVSNSKVEALAKKKIQMGCGVPRSQPKGADGSTLVLWK